MSDQPLHTTNLPSEQAAIRAKCFHRSGEFTEFPKTEIEQSIPERFEKMVRQFPNRIAVKAGDQSLTYAELNFMANALARRIIARRGLGQEPIGLLLAKGGPLVVAVFGVLKAGKMYVLLDPSHPTARNRFILDHAQAPVIITDTEHLGLANGLVREREQIINVVEPDSGIGSENPALIISPETIAWIHYTSGSTGEPKGVIQTHRNALYKVMRDTNDYHVCPSDRFTFPASRGGDMFLALLNGASVFPVEIKEEGFLGLAECLHRDEISIFTSVTSTFRHFVNSFNGAKKFPNLRLIRLIGEPLYKNDVELFKTHFSPSCILLNRLGSNETGNFCQYFIDRSTSIADGVVPVGYPVHDKEVLLLNDDGKDVGVNQVGEFAVRNRHLAIGYWRNPELTQTAFQFDSEGGDKRIYRVGDLGRRLPNGCFVHLGRRDFQVKIRGNRVEIAEVEAALLSCRNIKEAVVVGKEDSSGDKRLIAYVVPDGARFPTAAEMRLALAAKLPDFMIPAAYVMMDNLPVTGIGKVDRRALPEPSHLEVKAFTDYAAPRNNTERILCRAWSEILGVERVGIDDNFFAIGGHSLLAAKMFARLDEEFGRSFPLGILLAAPTVRLLAERYDTSILPKQASALVPLMTAGTLPPIYAVPGIFGNIVGYSDLSQALGVEQPFYAFQSVGLDGKAAPLDSVEEMAKRYVSEMREVQPHGPYAIIGACFGATVAYEMAWQLLDAGDEVAFLGLLDPARRERYEICINRLPVPQVIKRSRAFSNLVMARLQLYLKEMWGLERGDRIKFIKNKIHSLGFKIGDTKSLKGVQRELHQLEVYRANRLALRRYRQKPINGRLRAFEIFESSHPRNIATWTFNWADLWKGAAIRHHVPGKDSGDMVSEKNSRVLGPLLARRLRAAFSQDSVEIDVTKSQQKAKGYESPKTIRSITQLWGGAGKPLK
jgi:amino acid adenylation domain-containing protein